MLIGDRLREFREAKHLSQGDVEKRTGLLRYYLSRVENGHTASAVETLEKFARALEVPLYQLFYEGERPPALPSLASGKKGEEIAWGITGKDARYLAKLTRALNRMSARDREVLFLAAQKMVRGSVRLGLVGHFSACLLVVGMSTSLVYFLLPAQFSAKTCLQIKIELLARYY
jgi:transcriptional regulator with XRE-family HTH domain